MRRGYNQKGMAMALAIAIIMLSFLSSALIMSHTSHCCAPNNCKTCTQIASVSDVLALLFFAAVIGFMLLSERGTAWRARGMAASLLPHPTPISLKIRMNN